MSMGGDGTRSVPTTCLNGLPPWPKANALSSKSICPTEPVEDRDDKPAAAAAVAPRLVRFAAVRDARPVGRAGGLRSDDYLGDAASGSRSSPPPRRTCRTRSTSARSRWPGGRPFRSRTSSIRDEQGTLAEVPLVRSQKTLFQLASGYPDLGTFEITEPRANVVLAPGRQQHRGLSREAAQGRE